ncbi:n-acetylmuramoyl-l-alanine amidase domain protein [Firmicutes bacterium CAG:460]|nr:n-acetylmuramoyl-l-alanine amidase domain protein [Firmicutes bacterium CAG:460]
MEIKKCILVNNSCYKKASKMVPKGIVVHSTGANNPYLKRYVQPDDGILGKNQYNNDWNRSGVNACVNAFIGKDKNGIVRCYQTLPFDYMPWGCASGKKGSYNYTHIQFEICEDALKDEKYFNDAFGVAIDFCAYLCKEYNISVDNIVSHHESYLKGYGSNHADCDHWLKKFNKNMDWFRNEVKAKLEKKDVKPEPTKPNASDNFLGARGYIKLGDRGSNVEKIANFMYKTFPAYTSKAALGNYYGPNIQKSIKEFQKRTGLEQDGCVGPITLKMLVKYGFKY